MIRRALILAIAAVALLTGPVAAQDYDGTQASAAVQPDGDIVVTGEGFIPNSTVSYEVVFTADGQVAGDVVESGTTEADASGNVRFEIEGHGDGRYEITMTDGTNTAVASVTVGTPGTGGDADDGAARPLPTTGSDRSLPLGQLGVVLVMVGGVAVYAAKRRRNKSFV